MGYLSQTGYFGGQFIQNLTSGAGDILTPAARAFIIRTPIYIGLLAYAVYQSTKVTGVASTVSPLLIVNLLAQGGWYYFATQPGLVRVSAILILIMRTTLLFITGKLRKTQGDRTLFRCATLPMSVYFARLTIASPLNIAASFKDRGAVWATTSTTAVIGRIGLARVTSLIIQILSQRISYYLVIVRSLIAVMSARAYDAPIIFRTALGLAVISTIAQITVSIKSRHLQR